MALVSNLASLNLIRPEVDVNLEQVEAQVGSYVEDRENPAILASSVEAMAQVLGAVRVAELPGAIELADALTHLLQQVQSRGPDAVDEDFAALGQGIMVLGRYLEYVQLSQSQLPQLLVTAINQVRVALHQPPLAEGHFLPVPEPLPAPPSVRQLELSPQQLDGVVRRSRLMYQTGLIAVLRDQGDVPHFRMMSRACERAQQVCGARPQALLWWAASAALEAFQHGVELTPHRKSVLGQLDRQMKALAKNDGNGPPDRRLLEDCLYAVTLAEAGSRVDEVKKTFWLGDCKTQAQVQAEYELMCGPGGSVIKTVAEVVKDELAQVKETLDVMSRGSKNDAESYVAMADSLARMSQTLVMLGLIDDSQAVRRHADAVRAWEGTPAQASLDGLVDALMGVENSVAGLVRRVTPGAETTVNNARISLHQLDEARALLVAESRSGLSLAKRALSSYLESNHDLMHLANVPATLQSVVGGLSFLGIGRGGGVLRACARYIDERMLASEQQPGMAEMETLADAISSVDYYLESLEAGKPMGESILEIAEDSVAELGYPVDAAQAA